MGVMGIGMGQGRPMCGHWGRREALLEQNTGAAELAIDGVDPTPLLMIWFWGFDTRARAAPATNSRPHRRSWPRPLHHRHAQVSAGADRPAHERDRAGPGAAAAGLNARRCWGVVLPLCLAFRACHDDSRGGGGGGGRDARTEALGRGRGAAVAPRAWRSMCRLLLVRLEACWDRRISAGASGQRRRGEGGLGFWLAGFAAAVVDGDW